MSILGIQQLLLDLASSKYLRGNAVSLIQSDTTLARILVCGGTSSGNSGWGQQAAKIAVA